MYGWNNYIEIINNSLLGIFLTFAVVQVFYYLRYYFPVLSYSPVHQSNIVPVSVIICARNEAENLEKNLSFVLEQNHPDFEVIVVNDCSTDNTDEVLGRLLSKYSNLRITNIPLDRKFSHGKKLALTVGIKAAKNEWLVFTDADCKPESNEWLSQMQEGFAGKKIVLGYGGYYRKPGILNNYIRYETVFIALQYLGMALAKNPYMGVGRNMAYQKSLFFKNKGFASHYGLLSGDDDLFISEVATKTNTGVIITPDSFTRSDAKSGWGAYFNQKIRHLSTASKYKPRHKFILGLESISRAWFYVSAIILLFFNVLPELVLPIIAFRFILQLITFIQAGRKFKEKYLWVTFFIFDVYSLFFNFVSFIGLAFRHKKIRWK